MQSQGRIYPGFTPDSRDSGLVGIFHQLHRNLPQGNLGDVIEPVCQRQHGTEVRRVFVSPNQSGHYLPVYQQRTAGITVFCHHSGPLGFETQLPLGLGAVTFRREPGCIGHPHLGIAVRHDALLGDQHLVPAATPAVFGTHRADAGGLIR